MIMMAITLENTMILTKIIPYTGLSLLSSQRRLWVGRCLQFHLILSHIHRWFQSEYQTINLRIDTHFSLYCWQMFLILFFFFSDVHLTSENRAWGLAFDLQLGTLREPVFLEWDSFLWGASTPFLLPSCIMCHLTECLLWVLFYIAIYTFCKTGC